jgi:hypothetical protein
MGPSWFPPDGPSNKKSRNSRYIPPVAEAWQARLPVMMPEIHCHAATSYALLSGRATGFAGLAGDFDRLFATSFARIEAVAVRKV